MKYVWVSGGAPVDIYDDPLDIYENEDYSADYDKVYQLGPEVRFELKVSVVPTARTATLGKRPFEAARCSHMREEHTNCDDCRCGEFPEMFA